MELEKRSMELLNLGGEIIDLVDADVEPAEDVDDLLEELLDPFAEPLD